MDLKEYVKPLVKWWWLLVLSTVVAAVSAFIAKRSEPPLYQVQATVIIGQTISNPNPNGSEFWLSQQLAETYINIAQRQTVRDAAMESLGLTWLPEYSVRAVPNTQLIELSVKDFHPERAAAVANALVDQLVAQSPTQQSEEQARRDFISGQLVELQAGIEETSEALNEKQSQLVTLVSARQIADTEQEIFVLQNKLANLRATYASLLSNTEEGAINSLRVIEYADVPVRPINSGLWSTVAVAAALGLTLASGAAYFLEYLDDSVRSPDDVERATSLPMLAAVTKVPDDAPSVLVTRDAPRSVISETFRSLRTGIQFATFDSKQSVVLVTSPGPAEGKSSVASNLAVVMAQAGLKTLLVDADLRRPSVHHIFELDNYFGLSNLLLAWDTTSSSNGFLAQMEPLLSTEDNLSLLTSGALPPNPSELLGSAKMRSFIEGFRNHFDVVIIDSPPAMVVTDSVVLSTLVDGVLLVAEFGRTSRNQLELTANKLHEVNAKILGVALNKISRRSAGYYYYQGGEYYSTGSSNGNGRGGIRSRLLGGRNKRDAMKPQPSQQEALS